MSDNKRNPLTINDCTSKKVFTYGPVILLTLEVLYPEIRQPDNTAAQNRMNRYYRSAVRAFCRYANGLLLKRAMSDYRQSVITGYPFRAYDAVMHYGVTLNDGCCLSTYFDRYEYTGGAHGSTLRTSVSFNAQDGCKLTLDCVLKDVPHWKEAVLEQLLAQADLAMQHNPNIYFENYRQLIVENFNPESFNLTPDGLDIYYQQYDVGPYASGIITFHIPYANLGIASPCCGIFSQNNSVSNNLL